MRMLAGQAGGTLTIHDLHGTLVRLEFPLQSADGIGTKPVPEPSHGS